MRGNPDPYKARVAKARKRLEAVVVGDLDEVRRALTLALCELVQRIDKTKSTEETCRLTNAVTRVASELRAIFSSIEFENRLSALEEAAMKGELHLKRPTV